MRGVVESGGQPESQVYGFCRPRYLHSGKTDTRWGWWSSPGEYDCFRLGYVYFESPSGKVCGESTHRMGESTGDSIRSP
jgi:hypothetical protein